MYEAGYDPQQMIAFFEKIEELQKTKPGLIAKTFATHPQTPARVERTQHEIATILPPRRNILSIRRSFTPFRSGLCGWKIGGR